MSRFLQEYQKHNITFWGLTAQNEPTDGYIYKHFFQAMGFTPEQQRDFIKLDLGPALHNNSFGDIKLMILDDNRLLLPYWAEQVSVFTKHSGFLYNMYVCLTIFVESEMHTFVSDTTKSLK